MSADKKVHRGRPPKKFTPELKRYAAYLARTTSVTQKTAMDYATAADEGTLTRYVRKNCPGLPADFTTLLALKTEGNTQTLEQIFQWWIAGGKKGYRNSIHMSALLGYCGSTKTEAWAYRLSPPPYGLNFPDLLALLEQLLPTRLPSFEVQGTLLSCLADHDKKKGWGNWTDPQSQDFRALRTRVMKVKSASAANRLTKNFFSLPNACRKIALTFVRHQRQALLDDLIQRPVAYHQSLWPLLNGLYVSRSEFLAGEAIFRLVRAVFRDYDPAQLAPSAHAAPGDALRDAAFWSSPLLWGCLLQQPPVFSSEELNAFPVPEELSCRQWRDPAYFLTLREGARLPVDKAPLELWNNAADRSKRAIDFWQEHGEALLARLRNPDPLMGHAFPRSELDGDPDTCFLYLRLQKGNAEIEYRRALRSFSSPSQQMLSLSRAATVLERTESLLKDWIREKLAFRLEDELEDGQPVCLPLLVECLLLSAQVRVEKARKDFRALSPDFFVSQYVEPTRKDLEEALAYLKPMLVQSVKEANRLQRDCEQQCSACYEVLFSVPPALPEDKRDLRQKLLQEGAVQEEAAAWPRRNVPGGPTVMAGFTRESAPVRPVFCSCFDSVRSATGEIGQVNENEREREEATLVQTVASAKTLVMTYNQLTDNRNILDLLSIPALRALCQKQILAASSFGNYRTPIAYQCACLNNQNFIFSSTRLFSLDGPTEETIRGQNNRKHMLAFLTAPLSRRRLQQEDWAAQDWEEANRLAQAYQYLDECFPMLSGRDPYRQRSQDSSALSRTIGGQIEIYLKNSREPKQRALLLEMEGWAKHFGALASRSQYLHAIQNERDTLLHLYGRNAKEPDGLKMFELLVQECYNISIGRSSRCTICLSNVDPALQLLSGDGEDFHFLRTNRRKPVLQRARLIQRSESAQLMLENLLEIALLVRDIWDQDLPSEQTAAQAERETGFRYESTAEDIHVTDLTLLDSRGTPLRISPGGNDPSAPSWELEEWHLR